MIEGNTSNNPSLQASLDRFSEDNFKPTHFTKSEAIELVQYLAKLDESQLSELNLAILHNMSDDDFGLRIKQLVKYFSPDESSKAAIFSPMIVRKVRDLMGGDADM